VLVHEVALHDGYLSCRTAEGLQRDREPRLDGLPDRNDVGNRTLGAPNLGHGTQAGGRPSSVARR